MGSVWDHTEKVRLRLMISDVFEEEDSLQQRDIKVKVMEPL